jgi:hypothetical protein
MIQELILIISLALLALSVATALSITEKGEYIKFLKKEINEHN